MKTLIVVLVVSILISIYCKAEEQQKAISKKADVTLDVQNHQSDSQLGWQRKAPHRYWNAAGGSEEKTIEINAGTLTPVPEATSGSVACGTCIAPLQRNVYNMNTVIKQLETENKDIRNEAILTNAKLKSVLEAARRMENEFAALKKSMRIPGLAPVKSPSVVNTRQALPVKKGRVYKDCYAANIYNRFKPGVYSIQPSGSPYLINTVCDDGWAVIQRRFDGSENFNRPHSDYKTGFGSLSGELWIGLENLHVMTRNRNYTLRVDVSDFTNKLYFAVYDGFYVDSEINEYTLHLGEPLVITEGKNGMRSANRTGFTSRDHDNDNWRYGNCAKHFRSGFWLNNCGTDLNRPFCSRGRRGGCMRWSNIFVKSSLMRIKPHYATRSKDLKPPL